VLKDVLPQPMAVVKSSNTGLEPFEGTAASRLEEREAPEAVFRRSLAARIERRVPARPPTSFDPPLRIVGPASHVITRLGDWRRYAPPAGQDSQWRDGRGAKELARAWVGRSTRPSPPSELVELLETNSFTHDMRFGLVMPEARLRLDPFKGNTRQVSVAAHGQAASGPTLVAVEAADRESFSNHTIEEVLEPRSPIGPQIPERIDRLSRLILDRPAKRGSLDPEVAEIRYRLVNGIAGALLEADAQKARRVVFVVHEFLPARSGDEGRALTPTDVDLDRFLKLVGADPLTTGELLEVNLPKRSGATAIPLFIGRIVTELSQPGAR